VAKLPQLLHVKGQRDGDCRAPDRTARARCPERATSPRCSEPRGTRLVIGSRLCNHKKCMSAIVSFIPVVKSPSRSEGTFPHAKSKRCSVAKVARFDPSTVAVMKVALDDAWNCLRPEAQATVPKVTLAERILKSASQGERDCERLRETALRGLVA
jgi:hypothetical protein